MMTLGFRPKNGEKGTNRFLHRALINTSPVTAHAALIGSPVLSFPSSKPQLTATAEGTPALDWLRLVVPTSLGIECMNAVALNHYCAACEVLGKSSLQVSGTKENKEMVSYRKFVCVLIVKVLC